MSVSRFQLSGIFSDGSELFRVPAEPEPGEETEVRLRMPSDLNGRVLLRRENPAEDTVMRVYREENGYAWYTARIPCGTEPVRYSFWIECADGTGILYDQAGAALESEKDEPLPFVIFPGFHVPEWAKGAVQYQIFTDRFRNGDPANDVADGEYYYSGGHVQKITDWNALPSDGDFRRFYGGDLQGILDKLDYLQELGVEVLYLNPIFVSPSNHKYDIQDYEHVDPHFGVIVEDTDHRMQDWEKHNGFASRYIRRVTSTVNLEKSDELFEKLCEELHRRGMKIILDGVFNHCGSFNKWMDREGIYLYKAGYQPGAWQSQDSPWRSYFKFTGTERSTSYEGWWDYETLPKLNYEESPALWEEILRIAEKWAAPPYRIDGWRLDVAADLGHSEAINHAFWQAFRQRVKAVNPNLLIVAEHYGDPSRWLEGNEWDTVMNYDAFMEPVTRFLTGMEKHSDEYREDLYRNGPAFFETIKRSMARFSRPSLLCAMNELSNHDHSRFMTRTNHRAGRVAAQGSEAAGIGIEPGTFRMAVVIQMTWPGAPTIYYADEAGQIGWTDPDNRRTYPWGHEDESLICLHRDLATLRKQVPMLKQGSFKPLLADTGLIVYARFNAVTRLVIAVNDSDETKTVQLEMADIGAPDGEKYTLVFRTDAEGHFFGRENAGFVKERKLDLSLAAGTSAILCNE